MEGSPRQSQDLSDECNKDLEAATLPLETATISRANKTQLELYNMESVVQASVETHS
jgi:hypothetical protein